MPQRDFCFWKWIWASMNLLKTSVKQEWQDKWVYFQVLILYLHSVSWLYYYLIWTFVMLLCYEWYYVITWCARNMKSSITYDLCSLCFCRLLLVRPNYPKMNFRNGCCKIFTGFYCPTHKATTRPQHRGSEGKCDKSDVFGMQSDLRICFKRRSKENADQSWLWDVFTEVQWGGHRTESEVWNLWLPHAGICRDRPKHRWRFFLTELFT